MRLDWTVRSIAICPTHLSQSEEVGQPYEVRLVSFSEMKEPAHHAVHPFGQIPTYEEGNLALFETGAIVFHIADRYAGLLPTDAKRLMTECVIDVARVDAAIISAVWQGLRS